ncbi:MerR family transcriptional regulator [Brachybacterium sp. AOP25-B2-12]|uniref:MerR family transcriptional regulator n=1 Tax=Brachybacterium sp. AOP25-B2-12 TaxID=3457710 RepID=UPI0040339083
MRSAELARLADVSVRALRHYHQLGVLPEPERGSNGYRAYDVHDLVRVLRIKRLASLGIPLDRMPQLLDGAPADVATTTAAPAGPASGSATLLDELDAELAAQIERLTRRRELIARLRTHGTALDIPPELAPFVAVFQGDEVTPEIARVDHDQSVLLAHFVDEEGMTHLSHLYARISAPDLAPSVSAFSARFGALSADSPDAEVEQLVEEFLAIFGPVLAEFADEGADIDVGGASELFAAHTRDVLAEPQLRAIAEIGRRVDEGWAAHGRSPG